MEVRFIVKNSIQRREKMRKLVLILILCSFFFIGLQQNGFCAKKELITVLGLRIGSSGHMFATKITDTINMHVPEISATVITGSSKENPRNVQKNRGQLGFTSAQYAKMAYDGTAAYENMSCKDLRFFFFFVITLDNWIVRADSNIKSIEDLKDKKLCAGPKGYSLTEGALATLEAYGLTPEIIRKNGGNVSFASSKDCVKMLQDRIVDAIFAHSGETAIISQVLPAEQTIGVRPLTYRRDRLEKAIKILDRVMVIMDIKGGVYKAEPNSVLSFGTPFIFVIHKQVPDTLVYKMTKAIWEHQKDIRSAVGPFYNPFRLENALMGADIPIHPGALKYYKEVGVAR
jgi:TRAP transporter TAXI family solute receptor